LLVAKPALAGFAKMPCRTEK